MKKTLAILVALVFIASMPFAKGMRNGTGLKHEGFEPGERIKELLDLSDKQFEKLEELRADHMKEMSKIKIEMEKVRLEKKEIMLEDKIDYKKLLDLEKELSDLRYNLAKSRVEHLQKVEKILNDEQFEKFKMHMHRNGKRGGKAAGQGHKKGSGCGGAAGCGKKR